MIVEPPASPTVDLGSDPMLAKAQAVRSLSGLSGAYVYLLTEDGRHWFVRKAARNSEGNDRLRRQAAKQRAWQEASCSRLRVPDITAEGVVDGRYYFDMEAVRGVDGATYLRTADYAAVGRLADDFCSHLRAAAARRPLCDTTGTGDFFSTLFARVCEIQSVPAAAAIEPRDLNAVFRGLNRLRNRVNLTPTLCHGDLTLENIVIDADGTPWVLDLLDSPFEHFWQDVAKLHQDLDGGWYLRSRRPVARCATDFVGRRLRNETERLTPGYAEVHDVLLACTFLRILPYVRDDAALQFVHERIAHYARSIQL